MFTNTVGFCFLTFINRYENKETESEPRVVYVPCTLQLYLQRNTTQIMHYCILSAVTPKCVETKRLTAVFYFLLREIT